MLGLLCFDDVYEDFLNSNHLSLSVCFLWSLIFIFSLTPSTCYHSISLSRVYLIVISCIFLVNSYYMLPVRATYLIRTINRHVVRWSNLPHYNQGLQSILKFRRFGPTNDLSARISGSQSMCVMAGLIDVSFHSTYVLQLMVVLLAPRAGTTAFPGWSCYYWPFASNVALSQISTVSAAREYVAVAQVVSLWRLHWTYPGSTPGYGPIFRVELALFLFNDQGDPNLTNKRIFYFLSKKF